MFEPFSLRSKALDDSKDSRDTNDALGFGAGKAAPARVVVFSLIRLSSPFEGERPRRGNKVAQPKGCLVGDTW